MSIFGLVPFTIWETYLELPKSPCSSPEKWMNLIEYSVGTSFRILAISKIMDVPLPLSLVPGPLIESKCPQTITNLLG
jgi:hypothetical protein